MYEYPGIAEVQQSYPTVIRLLQKHDVPPAEAVKAVWTVASFGLSIYPGEPGTHPMFGAGNFADGSYDDLHAIADLELLADLGPAPKGGGLGAAAFPPIPWAQLALYLFGLLKQILDQWLNPTAKPA